MPPDANCAVREARSLCPPPTVKSERRDDSTRAARFVETVVARAVSVVAEMRRSVTESERVSIADRLIRYTRANRKDRSLDS